MVGKNLCVNMTCGASNISFGLPWRPVINSAFLAMAMVTGLQSAITNPLEIEIDRTVLAGDLLLGHDSYSRKLISAYRDVKQREVTSD